MSTASLRRALKRTALQALRSGGVYSRSANSHRRRQELLILCYHGVSLRDEHEWAGHLFVSPQRFQRRLAALRELKASVLPLAEGLKRLKSGSLPPRAVVITFDDGFVDFVGQAVPLLREFQLPSTLYLTTY
ncbi:MAG: polysaccharide deacetylase family protein, partial [Acidobacteriaceae bacterium]|nr:polysaccharide deacetylase family protein [Acidobacteriaceae bacterium]